MAKPIGKPAEAKAPTPPKKNWLVLVGIALVAAVGGGFMPTLLLRGQGHSGVNPKDKEPVYVPFGNIVADLRTPSQNRYLKIKIIMVTEKAEEGRLKELLTKNKALMMNAALGYLADRTVDDIRGTSGMNRIRRELLDQFNLLLYPDGTERIRDLLFEEYNTQ